MPGRIEGPDRKSVPVHLGKGGGDVFDINSVVERSSLRILALGVQAFGFLGWPPLPMQMLDPKLFVALFCFIVSGSKLSYW